MIDTTKFYAYMTDQLLDTLQDEQALKQCNTKLYGNRFFLKHPFKLASPEVRFDIEKRSFSLETSLPKLFQGHNVFGCNRVEYLCLQTIKLVYQQLGLRFTREQHREILEHRIRLGRLDVTCSFRLAMQKTVSYVEEAMWQHLRAGGFKWSAYGATDFETVYNQQDSTRVSDKFYNKHRELAAKKIPNGVAEWDRILEYVHTLLRFEVTWRGKELKRLDLDYADQWSTRLAREMLMERLAQLKLQGAIKGCVMPQHLNGLSDSCYMYYTLWTEGANLRRHRYNRTLDRAREQILAEHQVDIYRTTQLGNDISLKELLCAENAYFGAPKSLTSRGAIFGFPQWSH